MKILNVLLVLFLVLAVCAAIAMSFGAGGSNYMLHTMQSIREGMTQAEVREIMGQEPQVAAADQIPKWIEDVAGESRTGEFWYYFMGFPPRNLIIYFDEDGHVVYTTWAST